MSVQCAPISESPSGNKVYYILAVLNSQIWNQADTKNLFLLLQKYFFDEEWTLICAVDDSLKWTHFFVLEKIKPRKVALQGWMPVPEIHIYNKFTKIDDCGLSKRECYRILKTYFDVKKSSAMGWQNS